MKAKKLEQGNAQIAVYPVPLRGRCWIPSDAQEEALYSLKGDGWEVSEIASCGAQSYHVVLEFESFDVAVLRFGEASVAVLAAISA